MAARALDGGDGASSRQETVAGGPLRILTTFNGQPYVRLLDTGGEDPPMSGT